MPPKIWCAQPSGGTQAPGAGHQLCSGEADEARSPQIWKDSGWKPPKGVEINGTPMVGGSEGRESHQDARTAKAGVGGNICVRGAAAAAAGPMKEPRGSIWFGDKPRSYGNTWPTSGQTGNGGERCPSNAASRCPVPHRHGPGIGSFGEFKARGPRRLMDGLGSVGRDMINKCYGPFVPAARLSARVSSDGRFDDSMPRSEPPP